MFYLLVCVEVVFQPFFPLNVIAIHVHKTNLVNLPRFSIGNKSYTYVQYNRIFVMAAF